MMQHKTLSLAAIIAVVSSACARNSELPSDFRQLLARGRIAAVTDPHFVSADKATLRGDSWVLGVVMNGEAKAYSLNLLNSHEIVNDTFGDRPVAAVW